MFPIILLVAFVLRLIFLGSVPAGFTPDEASFGYDAYSILKTGKDQWGKTLPIVFESFGDFKSPVYGYLAIPTVAIFGLNKFAVRLPSAILGTLAVYFVFLLTKELLRDNKINIKSENAALIASFLLSVSPWHIALSRGAFESNLSAFFLTFGIILFLKSFKDHKLIIWSSVIFGINLFTYHSAKFVTPLIVFALILFYKKQLLKIGKRNLIYALVTFLVFTVVTVYSFSLGAGRRASDINIYNGSLVQAFDERTRLVNAGYNKYIAHLFYNKYTVTLNRFYKNYTSYFSIRFLFSKGPAESTYGMVQGVGVLFWVEIVSLATFLYTTFRYKEKANIFILFWILIAPIPAALSAGVGYAANRVAVMLPAIQIASAIGFAFLIESSLINRTKFKDYFASIVLVIILLGLSNFLHKYFITQKLSIDKQMLFGNLESSEYLVDNYSQKNILISTGISEPHIYWAFEGKIDPKEYQKETRMWNYQDLGLKFMDQMPEYKIKNITFKHIDWKNDSKKFDLIVGRPDEFPKGVVVKKVFYYSDSTAALYLIENNAESYAKVDYAKTN